MKTALKNFFFCIIFFFRVKSCTFYHLKGINQKCFTLIMHVIEGIKNLFPKHASIEFISLSMGHKEVPINQTTFSIGISQGIKSFL